ncbi:MAG: acetylglutamate kinase [Verrucomicrobiota bacterium]|nr:acetylglutamate kinase [Verrucomicrobiota bacterium]
MATTLDINQKAEVLIEALPYIQRFKGSVFVVKYGGSFVEDEEMRNKVITDLVFLSAVGINVVVVHGGGKAISRAMDEAGLKAVFNKGLRVTDSATMSIVERTLNKVINLDICETLQRQGGHPLGLPGQSLLVCDKLDRDENGQPMDLGYVGRILDVKTSQLRKAIADGYMPIVSPVGRDEKGQFYNTNADTAAACVASALRARRLVFMSDVPGLLRNPKDPSTLISTLRADEVPGLKAEGVIAAGMAPKVDSALEALQNGVHRVHFIDGRLPHSLLLEIFTDKGIGTEIVHPGRAEFYKAEEKQIHAARS